jgi:serine phosphatase RsbU (regulator of sigma subunit)
VRKRLLVRCFRIGAIQKRLLPSDLVQIDGYEAAGAWQAAGAVGGDYFDVIPFAGEKLGIVLLMCAQRACRQRY